MGRWIVCPECEGDGTVLCDAFRGVAVDQELMEDPDFREEYFGGHYDVVCPTCKGNRVVDRKEWEAGEEQRRADAEYRAEVEAERRFGA